MAKGVVAGTQCAAGYGMIVLTKTEPMHQAVFSRYTYSVVANRSLPGTQLLSFCLFANVNGLMTLI